MREIDIARQKQQMRRDEDREAWEPVVEGGKGIYGRKMVGETE